MNQDWEAIAPLKPETCLGLEPPASDRWLQLLDQGYQKLTTEPCQRLLLALPDPIEFLASLWAALITQTPVFLGNPSWRESQWQAVSDQIRPQQAWGDAPCAICPNPEPIPLGQIMIPTGGTSGQIRWAMHTWATLTAAVAGFQQFFGVGQVNSFCVLPLYHVSGLMQFWRSLLTGGRCTLGAYTDLKQGHWPSLPQPTGFLSLVPTQLQRLLDVGGVAWLRQFDTLLLGGAPAWPELLARARHERLRLAPTYGMTETAAQVVTLRPADFLAGNKSSGQVLPHAQVRINDQGQVEIQARS
ncbi:MAG: AMP-binding protein, partial [Spirulinaceae cyanobacterium]